MKAFGRVLRLTVGTTEVSGLDATFTVKKTIKPEPNTLDLRVWNLSESTRKALQSTPKVAVRLEAGYAEGTSLLYLGESRTAWTEVSGPDLVTHLEAGDKEDATKRRINVPVGPGAPVSQVVSDLIAALGVGAGNSATVLASLSAAGVASLHPRGGVLQGNAYRQLQDYCLSVGLEFSIQDGVAQLVRLGAPIAGVAVELTTETGLVGSPSVDAKGEVTCTCLLIPELTPGRAIVLRSAGVVGQFRLTEVEYTGDTAGTDWYAKVTGVRY